MSYDKHDDQLVSHDEQRRYDPRAAAESAWMLSQAMAPPVRPMGRFAQEEIILPNGPFAGRQYRVEYQPYAGLYFDAVDHGPWNTFNATGPSQSGKTLTCSVIPVLYHLFEIQETVIFGLPDLDMAGDKWREDILPVLERTRYRDLIPSKGAGSRGGTALAIRFKNGATLRFMTGGGGDKSRAGYTARVLVITETDGMDTAADTSEEADKIAQLVARTRAFGQRRRVYLECTLTTRQGRTWREYEAGTASRILLKCPHCGQWVSPERQHLTGWEEAEDELAAMEHSRWCCPACARLWSELERAQANRAGRLLHRGQTIAADGTIQGELPRTLTLGFRWTAVNNLFVAAGDVGAAEWKASRAEDEENAKRELCQFIHCQPYEPQVQAVASLSARAIMERTARLERGELPPWAEALTLGCDLGKHAGHWCVVAWGEGALGHVVDYGVIEIHGAELGVERAILAALRDFNTEVIMVGWGQQPRRPRVCCFDSMFQGAQVRQFCREAGEGYYPTVGYGATQRTRYSHPTRRSDQVRILGEQYHAIRASEGCRVVNINSDYWKTWVHQRLTTPLGEPGSLTLFAATDRHQHLSFAKHLTAERKLEKFLPGRGTVTTWEQMSRNNHWLDALELAAVAGHLAGVRLEGERPRMNETDEAIWRAQFNNGDKHD